MAPQIRCNFSGVQEGSTRFKTRGDHDKPWLSSWRMELTALSQIYNLYFVACIDKIYVYEPGFPDQRLTNEPALIISPPKSKPGLQGSIDLYHPHSITRLHVDFLGNHEIVLVTCDDGDVIGYSIPSIQREIERLEECPREEDTDPEKMEIRVILHRNVERSAWGLAVHREARMVAISSNTHVVSVLAFALARPEDSDLEDDMVPSTESDPSDFPWPRRQNHVLTLPANNNIPSVSFDNTGSDPEGRWLMSAVVSGRVQLWDLHRPHEPARTIEIGFCSGLRENDPPNIAPLVCVCSNSRDLPHAAWSTMFVDPRSCRRVSSLEEAVGSRPIRYAPSIWVTQTILKSSDRKPATPCTSSEKYVPDLIAYTKQEETSTMDQDHDSDGEGNSDAAADEEVQDEDGSEAENQPEGEQQGNENGGEDEDEEMPEPAVPVPLDQLMEIETQPPADAPGQPTAGMPPDLNQIMADLLGATGAAADPLAPGSQTVPVQLNFGTAGTSLTFSVDLGGGVGVNTLYTFGPGLGPGFVPGAANTNAGNAIPGNGTAGNTVTDNVATDSTATGNATAATPSPDAFSESEGSDEEVEPPSPTWVPLIPSGGALVPPAPQTDLRGPRRSYCALTGQAIFSNHLPDSAPKSPILITTKDDIFLLQPFSNINSPHPSGPIVCARNPLFTQPTTTKSSDRLCYTAQIPELGIFIVGSPFAGRVAVFRFTQFDYDGRNDQHSTMNPKPPLPQKQTQPQRVFGFRQECLVPNTKVSLGRLVGFAVGPMQGMESSAPLELSDAEDTLNGMYARQRASSLGGRRWRLMLHYSSHTVLSYDLGGVGGVENTGLGKLVV